MILKKIKGTNSNNINVKPSKGLIDPQSAISIEFLCHSMNIDNKQSENENFNARFMLLAITVPPSFEVLYFLTKFLATRFR